MLSQTPLTAESRQHSLKDFAGNLGASKTPNGVRSYLFKISAWMLFVIDVIALLFVERIVTRTGIPLFVLSIPMALIFHTFYKLRRLGELHSQNALDTVLNDTRPPVLYLRPFEDDLDTNPSRNDLKTPEELLANLFKEVGPVVAVGDPGKGTTLPTTIRFYFNDNEWQEKVKALISISKIVIVQAGINQGIEWEMVTAKEMLKPNQLLFSFVHLQLLADKKRLKNEYQIFRRQFERFYKQNLPEQIGDAYFLYFEDAWIPKLAHTDRIGRLWKMKETIFGIRGALKPILKRYSINLKMKWADFEPAIIFILILSLIFIKLSANSFRSAVVAVVALSASVLIERRIHLLKE